MSFMGEFFLQKHEVLGGRLVANYNFSDNSILFCEIGPNNRLVLSVFELCAWDNCTAQLLLAVVRIVEQLDVDIFMLADMIEQKTRALPVQMGVAHFGDVGVLVRNAYLHKFTTESGLVIIYADRINQEVYSLNLLCGRLYGLRRIFGLMLMVILIKNAIEKRTQLFFQTFLFPLLLIDWTEFFLLLRTSSFMSWSGGYV